MSPISAYMPAMGGVMPNVDSLPPETTQLNAAGIPNLAALTMENSPLTSVQGTTGTTGVTGPGASMPIEMPSELAAPAPVGGGDDTFSSLLSNLVNDVNQKQAAAGQSVAALQSGQTMPLHQAVIAMEEANVSFQLMVEVRNRLLDAYQEVMRMQV